VLHSHKAKAFNLTCTPSLTNPQRCLEFPHSPTPLILCIAALYRDRPRSKLDTDIIQSHAFTDPSRPANRSNSNSSNSDSGFGRDDANVNSNDRVCIVDMQAENPAGSSIRNNAVRSNSNSAFRNTATTTALQGSSVSRSLSALNNPMSPSAIPTPFTSPRGLQRPMSAFEVRRGLNNSSSSEECWVQGKNLFVCIVVVFV
jgi:hypothetical protein